MPHAPGYEVSCVLDWLLTGLTVVDGTGAPARQGNVGIRGDAIALRDLQDAAARVLNCRGLVAAPGFIDTHTHSDLLLLTDQDHSVKLLQGVTTEVIGLDGASYAPLSPGRLAEMLEYGAGINGLPPPDTTWSSVAEFLALFDQGVACNALYMIPHGALRIEVMGWERRPARPDEIAAMASLLRQGLDEGGHGMSVGLTYAPGEFATTDELVALAEVLAEHDALYVPHERFHQGDLLDCTGETLDICRRAGCSALISHLFVLPKFSGRAGELLDLIDAGIAEGLDLHFDAHPYLAGNSWLAAIAPAWVAEAGPHTLREKLRDPGVRERVAAEIEWDWSKLTISGIAGGDTEGLEGMSVAQIAQDRGQTGAEAVVDLLAQHGWGIAAITGGRDPKDVPAIITHPRCMISSDGILVGGRPHPRGYGCFPRILREYWREGGLLSLEDAVHKMTGLPAQRLRLSDRGNIAEGLRADLVIFDPDTVAEGNSMQRPTDPPVGIRHVFVNGELAVIDGKRTDVAAGRMLR